MRNNLRGAYLLRHKRQRALGGVKIAGAQQPVVFGQAKVVGKLLVGHLNIFLFQGLGEFLFQHGALAPRSLGQEFLDAPLLIVGNVDAVGMHPAAEPCQSPWSAHFQHPVVIVPGNELPGRAQQVRADDASFIESAFESSVGRLLRTHRDCPAHRPVILRLHCAEPRNHLRRILELRNDELLAEKACGNRIHSVCDLQKYAFYRVFLVTWQSEKRNRT